MLGNKLNHNWLLIQHQLFQTSGYIWVLLENTNLGDFGDRGTTSRKNGALSSHKGEATCKRDIKMLLMRNNLKQHVHRMLLNEYIKCNCRKIMDMNTWTPAVTFAWAIRNTLVPRFNTFPNKPGKRFDLVMSTRCHRLSSYLKRECLTTEIRKR